MIVINKTIMSVNVVRDLWGVYQACILYASPTDPAGSNDTRYVYGFGGCVENAIQQAFGRYADIPNTWDGV